MSYSEAVLNFETYLERKLALDSALALIFWDQSTGAPKGGAAARAKTVGILSGESFAMSVSDEMKKHLDILSKYEELFDDKVAAMYRICKKDYESMEKIPKDEFAAYSELLSGAEVIWEEAKEKNNYLLFAPVLSQIIGYLKKFINYRGFTSHPYNTLLDDYEPGLNVTSADLFFAEIKEALAPLLKKITESGKKLNSDFTKTTVPVEIQQKIADFLMAEMGFDFNRGMLKTSEHPFTNGTGRTDVRITTHYYENSFLSSMYSVLHETGHAIYEQNTEESLEGTILDSGISMGIHESQSRFYENIIGRSSAFWENIHERLLAILPDEFKNITARDFYLAANVVKPSLIRIEADELTYTLHILIRYEMEKYIFSNDVDVYELPALWNKKYEEYMGIKPGSDAEGILQDVHWASGLFGYFPSYSLGNAYAAQRAYCMNRDFDVNSAIRNGDYAKIKQWLTDKIHKHASVLLPAEIIQKLSGQALNAKYFTEYCYNKFTEIYEI
ncbi:MAG: carboxypeptidase M32 [Clostridiales bacterium]|nr:carboxypeptidase M32 [Clostridiales bacterium]